MKTIKKRIFALMAVLMVSIMAFSVPAMAAGTETWYGPWVDEPTIVVTNNNLTPVKTMGKSGTLHVGASIKGRPDLEPPGCPKVKLTMQIRDLAGNVLAEDDVTEDAFMPQVHLEIPVTQGQKVQIFFDVSSVSYNPNGNWRVGEISYGHEIY